jgi:HK97 family phage portal protein
MSIATWFRERFLSKRHIGGEETWLPVPTLAGVPVTTETALAFGTFFSGVCILSSDLAAIPFRLVKEGPKGARVVDSSHRVNDLVFHEPNPDTSAVGFWQSVMWHCLTHGNSYSEIERDEYLRPVALHLLDPRKVTPRRTYAEEKLYYVVDGEPFLPADIFHVANVGSDGVVGRSPVQQCRETLGLGIGAEKFGAAYFGNGISDTGVLTTAQKYDEMADKQFRKQINEVHQGPFNAHKFMLLWNGMTFTKTSKPPDEAQFLQTRTFQVEEIARILNMPPTKLQAWAKANFNSLEEANSNYYQSTLLPWVRRIESEGNRKLLSREERRIWSIEHDTSASLRGRMLDQANHDKILKEMGALNVDEIRAKRGMGPVEGGSTYFVPLNFAPLHEVASASIETLKGMEPKPRPTDDQTPAEPQPATGPGEVVSPTADVQDTALNGAQIVSLQAIVQSVADGTLPAEAAKGLLAAAFPAFTPEKIDAILAPLNGFSPTPDGDVVESSRDVVLDVARRMVRREVNAVRKILRKGDLASILTALDAHYEGEAGTLAEAFAPALRAYSAATRARIDAAAFAGEIVKRSRSEILACVEGTDMLRSLGEMVERWDTSKAGAIAAAIN